MRDGRRHYIFCFGYEVYLLLLGLPESYVRREHEATEEDGQER